MVFIKNVAIISKNKHLSKMIELELLAHGISASILSAEPKDISFYDMIFFDVDTVPSMSYKDGLGIIAVTENKSTVEKYERVLTYPFLLSELNRIIIDSNAKKDGRDTERNIDEAFFYIDKEKKTVELFGRSITLSDYEFKILRRLCDSRGEVVSREELSALLGATDGNMADVYICYLRRKLATLTNQKIIYTVRSKGYMINCKIKA